MANDLTIATFNINGKNRSHMKTLIGEFIDDHLPDVVFFQEIGWRGDNIKENVRQMKEKYVSVTNKNFDAAVYYLKNKLKDSTPANFANEVFKKEFDGKKDLNFETFVKRSSFAVLTDTDQKVKKSFIVISWHGEHSSLTDEKKKDKLRDLLSALWQVHIEVKLPIILGGDFNISLDKIQDIIEEFDGDWKFHMYNQANRTNLIDFFVVTHDVTLTDVKAVGDYMYYENEDKDKDKDGNKDDDKKVFDHDPVTAKYKRTIAVVDGASEELAGAFSTLKLK